MTCHSFVSLLLLVLVCLSLSYVCGRCSKQECSLTSYVNEIKSEMQSLSCMATNLNTSVQLLNGTQWVGQREKQLKKILSTMEVLGEELKILQNACNEKYDPTCGSCPSGYTGTDCSISICSGILSNNELVCSGRGKCVEGGKCVCSNSKGVNCEDITMITTDHAKKFADGTVGVSCVDYLNKANSNLDGNYWIQPPGGQPFIGYCDMMNGGWIRFSIQQNYTFGISNFSNYSKVRISWDSKNVTIPRSDFFTSAQATAYWTPNAVLYFGAHSGSPIMFLIESASSTVVDFSICCGASFQGNHFRSVNPPGSTFNIGVRVGSDCSTPCIINGISYPVETNIPTAITQINRYRVLSNYYENVIHDGFGSVWFL